MKSPVAKLRAFFLENAAFRIAFIYAGFSTLWILFSDQILFLYFKETAILTRLQTLKGWVFITITALIIYFLLKQELDRLKQAEMALESYRDHLEELVRERTQTLEQEISEKQRAEKEFRDLLESAPDAMALVDSQGKMVLVNRQMEYLFGYSRAELLDHNIEILIPERFRALHRNNVRDFFTNPRVRQMGAELDIHGLARDGREFPADISLSPLETRGGIFVLADIRDITQRKLAEEKIARSYYFASTMNTVLQVSLESRSLAKQLEHILELILAIPSLCLRKMGSIYLVEETPEVLVLKAQQGYDEAMLSDCARVPFGACLCGQAAATSKTVFADCLAHCHKCHHDIFPHGHYCVPILSGDQVLGVLNLVLREGHARDDHEEGFLSAIAATLAGIIERKKAELGKERLRRQLVEAEKLSALGRLTANVAHEIRNPLTVVGGLAKRLEQKIPDGTKEKEYSRVILAESLRLERILKSVLALTKKPRPHNEAIDLTEVVEESLRFFSDSVRKKSIALHKSFVAVPPVLVDHEDARAVIDNLLSNALYATPAGGVIAVATDSEVVEGKGYVTVRVSDTGPGINEDVLPMIFEPFFTTKPVGPDHGIGLGLPVSKKIMEEYGGYIRVSSPSGEGSTFKLFFPVQTTGALTTEMKRK